MEKWNSVVDILSVNKQNHSRHVFKSENTYALTCTRSTKTSVKRPYMLTTHDTVICSSYYFLINVMLKCE